MKLFEIKNKFNDRVIFSLKCESFNLCVQMAIKTKADLSRADLSRADLSRADLSRADLSRADLSWADLSWADLSEANLSEANLSRADLSWADLSEANLSEANLYGADLSRANLSWANLYEANLSRADLSRANLSEADLDFSAWPLHCGSFSAKADDRLVAQLIHHVGKLDVSNCSGGVKEAVEYIREMAISDLFCEYRSDIKKIKENKND